MAAYDTLKFRSTEPLELETNVWLDWDSVTGLYCELFKGLVLPSNGVIVISDKAISLPDEISDGFDDLALISNPPVEKTVKWSCKRTETPL